MCQKKIFIFCDVAVCTRHEPARDKQLQRAEVKRDSESNTEEPRRREVRRGEVPDRTNVMRKFMIISIYYLDRFFSAVAKGDNPFRDRLVFLVRTNISRHAGRTTSNSR